MPISRASASQPQCGRGFPGSIQGSFDAVRSPDPAGSARHDRGGLLGTFRRLPPVVELTPDRGTSHSALSDRGASARGAQSPCSNPRARAGDRDASAPANRSSTCFPQPSRTQGSRAGPDRVAGWGAAAPERLRGLTPTPPLDSAGAVRCGHQVRGRAHTTAGCRNPARRNPRGQAATLAARAGASDSVAPAR